MYLHRYRSMYHVCVLYNVPDMEDQRHCFYVPTIYLYPGENDNKTDTESRRTGYDATNSLF